MDDLGQGPVGGRLVTPEVGDDPVDPLGVGRSGLLADRFELADHDVDVAPVADCARDPASLGLALPVLGLAEAGAEYFERGAEPTGGQPKVVRRPGLGHVEHAL